jgi:diguanylate cyclase (GGDEF)-like protein
LDLASSPEVKHMNDDLTMAITGVGTPDEDACDKPAALLMVAGDDIGTLFDLGQDETLVGRSAEADITLEFAGLSRRHVLLQAAGDAFVLHDCDSKNGTFVNDQRVEAAVVLRKGDIIRLGPVMLQYIPRGDPERLAYDRLNHRTRIDRFTGCYNKSYLNERLELETRACNAKTGALGLIVFDLDHFKSLNDGYGHDAGDLVLKELSGLIHANGVRKQDVFARYGGEEFAILLPGTPRDACTEIAERLRRLIAEHRFEYDGQRLPVSISIGVAGWEPTVADGTELFRRADAALYAAKHAGRNQVRVHGG